MTSRTETPLPARAWKKHVLIDSMDHGGPNEWWCSCGVRLWPDCDMSIASVVECFEEHLAGRSQYDD